MVVLKAGEVYHGEDAMHVLALLTSPSGVFNRLTAWTFSRPRAARLAYPLFKRDRRAVLALLRRPLIASPDADRHGV